ncbi:MAG: hypothetical protein IPJ43_17105 [Saprospiraceae bacterium]|nr:hypothetical protein [Saprospiraceae bacterium]
MFICTRYRWRWYTNQFDLDSDADGCSDAFEGGATTNSTVSTFAGPYDSNGYANSLEKLIAYTVNITRPVLILQTLTMLLPFGTILISVVV